MQVRVRVHHSSTYMAVVSAVLQGAQQGADLAVVMVGQLLQVRLSKGRTRPLGAGSS